MKIKMTELELKDYIFDEIWKIHGKIKVDKKETIKFWKTVKKVSSETIKYLNDLEKECQ